MEILGVCFVYAGLIVALVAAVSAIKPLGFIGIRSRLQALAIAGLALGAIVLGMILPARETHVVSIESRLDEFSPVYQFNEEHTVTVRASPQQCYAAIRQVGPEEIALFRTLTWMRRFGRRGPESIVNAPEHRPILETAIRTGFLLLAEDRGREIVIGAVMGPPTPEWARDQRSPRQSRRCTPLTRPKSP